jgi:nucleoside-diphosphate-sugar epimerase
MAQKILVTGGAGYLGSTLVPLLLHKGYEVTVLDNFMFQQNSLMECCADNKFSVVHGDARDEGLLTSVITDKDYIIPLAALV